MKKLIFDSHAIITYFRKEEKWEEVARIIAEGSDPAVRHLMSVVNLGEVFYSTRRSHDDEEADRILTAISFLPIEIVTADRQQALQAARFKSRGGISYADCFAAALAYLEDGAVVTGDREFEVVEDDVEIIWIPRRN